jgi:hypothetical protein
MEGLTVHCVVRDEPFVYYAVKSVYEYVDVILLYDTGSTDAHTLSDIARLCEEDLQCKIRFKSIPGIVDETKWTKNEGPKNFRQMVKQNKDKKGYGFVRQMQIDVTDTKYFMILDGDEIHYKEGCLALLSAIKQWPVDKSCGFVPLIWFCDMNHTFCRTYSGRLFRTADIGMTGKSPCEMHTIKKTGAKIRISSNCSFEVPNMKAYAHFETHLKPWRRDVPINSKQVFKGELPEVMQEDRFFIERFQNESSHRKNGSK